MSVSKHITDSKKFLLRYLGISAVSYLYTLSGLLLLVEFFEVNEIISFILIYGSAYIILYVIQLRYLFNKKHKPKKLLRYLIAIIGFYITANLLYNFGMFLGFPYLLSAIFGIGIIIPLRIMVYKNYVYKD